MASGTESVTGIPMGVKPEDDRARLIIDAAYDLLDEAGLEGLTIRAVLSRTGLARRAFYECFAGKDDLVLAVFAQTLRAAEGFFRQQAEQSGGPSEAVRLIVAGLVVGSLAVPGQNTGGSDRRGAALSREHLRLAESRPEDLQSALSPLLNLIAEQVTQGIRAGQFRPCDADLQARLIYNLVATTVHTELLREEGEKPDKAHREALADTLWEFCRRAIVA